MAKQPTIGGGAVRKIEPLVSFILALVNESANHVLRWLRAFKRGPGSQSDQKGTFISQTGSTADAAEIGTIHVKATRFTYRGIYPDAYLEGLSPKVRARLWLCRMK